jgi:hypothetical protein
MPHCSQNVTKKHRDDACRFSSLPIQSMPQPPKPKMRKSQTVVPEHVLTKMDPRDRKKLGNAGRTQKEISAVNYVKSERNIHDQFASFLRRHDLPYVHSDPTKKSSIIAGHPDFLVTRGRIGVYIEFKIPPNQLSKVQVEYINFLVKNANEVHVIAETAPGVALQKAQDVITETFNL